MRILFFLLFISTATYAQDSRNVDVVNSPADEINPIIDMDSKTLYFGRVHEPGNVNGIRDPGDIWYSVYTDSSGWTTPVHLSGPLNNKQFNAVLDASGNILILYDHYMPDGSPPRTQGLSSSRRTGDSWSTPGRLDIKYFYNKSEHVSASISANGNIMVLAIQSYGTIGAEDIYVSFKDGREWSEPKNLGRTINTKFQEMTPYLAPDNKTLFFASNGHGGFGGRDIFVSRRLDDSWRNWTVPENLGPEINSEGVELYFRYFVNEEQAVYTSTRSSDGYSDIKIVNLLKEELESLIKDSITLPISEPVQIVENTSKASTVQPLADGALKLNGVVKDANTNSPINANLTFEVNGEEQMVSAPNGIYEIVLTDQEIYRITVEAGGYVGHQEVLDVRTTEFNSVIHNFSLQPIQVGTLVNLNNVLFVRGSTELLESSNAELDLVVKMMQENPNVEIELAGHTDNQGDQRLNQILSQNRVDAVINYITSHGINESRITGKGFGGTKPIASNESEESRQLNRRVEFTIVKN